MVPHIVFNEREKTYFPAADFYDITRSSNAPRHIGTSGMTQSPVHAIATYYIYENSKDKTVARELASCELFEAKLASSNYLLHIKNIYFISCDIK